MLLNYVGQVSAFCYTVSEALMLSRTNLIFDTGWGFETGFCWLHTISEVFQKIVPNSNNFLAVLAEN